MGQRVLGVGWGVFSLAFLWSLLLIAIIVLYRIRALLCLFLTLLVLLVTLILLVLPREEIGAYAFENVSDSMNFEQIPDSLFLLRIFTLITTFVAAIGGVAIFLYVEIIQPRKPGGFYNKDFLAIKKNA